jgi:hypothetical protein
MTEPERDEAAIELFVKMAVLYTAIMPDRHYDFSRGNWIVRLWDGMDGCWSDVTEETDAFTALSVWVLKTGSGKHNWRFDDIDYYRIFPAETRMIWDGEAGRELFRPPETEDDKRVVVEGFKRILSEAERDDGE